MANAAAISAAGTANWASNLSSGTRPLRSQPLDLPAPARAPPVEDAIVQPVRAVLPELDRVGREAIAAPVRRARHGLGMLALERREAALERATPGDPGALGRSPGSKLAAARARGEI